MTDSETVVCFSQLCRLESLCAYWNVNGPMIYKSSREDIVVIIFFFLNIFNVNKIQKDSNFLSSLGAAQMWNQQLRAAAVQLRLQ